jgi:hypothetical protein
VAAPWTPTSAKTAVVEAVLPALSWTKASSPVAAPQLMIKASLRGLRGEPRESPVIAKDEGGVGVEANVVLDARGLRLGAFEGGVDEHREGHVGVSVALRPAGRSLTEEVEAIVSFVGTHVDAAGVPRVSVVGTGEVGP